MPYSMMQNPYYGMNPTTYMNGIENPYWGNFNYYPEFQGDEQNISRQKNHGKQKEMHGHTHAHEGATTCQEGHTHLHPGVTGIPIQTQGGHVHKIYGYTTFDDGHIHYYEEYSSPPIPLPNGYHTHYAEIRTTENDGHTHIIKGFTEPSKS